MMRTILGAFIILAANISLWAQNPTQAPTGFNISASTPTSITLQWTNVADANRTNYMIMANTTGTFTPPTDGVAPTNDVDLTDGTAVSFGSIGASATTFAGFSVNAGTQYHFRIIPYNSGGATPPYYYAGAAVTTTGFTEPVQATNIAFSNLDATTLDVNWTNGGTGGASRIVVGRATSAVSFTPTDGTPIVVTASTDFTDGVNGDLGGGNRLLFSGSGSGPISISNLTASTTYHFRVYEFSGSGALINYNTATATVNPSSVATLAVEPTAQPTSMTFTSVTTTGFSVGYTNATGSPTGYLAIRRQGASPTGVPQDGTTYTVSTSLGDGTVVMVGTTNPFTQGSLGNETEYFFDIYAFNGSGASINYRQASPLEGNRFTLSLEPSNRSAAITANPVAGTTNIDIGLPDNSGLTNTDGVIILRAQGGTAPNVTGVIDGTAPGSLSLPGGTTYVATVASTAVTTYTDLGPLLPNTQYSYTVISYNANAGANGQTFNYFTSNTRTANATTGCVAPSTQANTLASPAKSASTIDLTWNRGDGTKVILLARASSSNTAVTLANGTTYTANPEFGSGTLINVSNPDYFVVYIGTGTSTQVTGLDGAQAYSFSLFEYNDNGGGGNPACYTGSPAVLANIVTNSASNNTTLTSGTGTAILPSTATTLGTRVTVFQFVITDAGDDGQQTDISQMIFRPLNTPAHNEIPNFQDLIAGAHLTDNLGGDQGFTATINPTNITISNIDRDVSGGSSNELGEIFNGNSKTYVLSVWFKNPLTGALPTTVDGLHLALSLSSADIMTDVGQSGMTPGQTQDSDVNGSLTNGQVSVVASEIRINQQPSTSANASVPLAQQPIFEATDANGSRDLGFNNALTVNTGNPANLGPTSAPAAFSAGLANFTASGFNFANTGTSTMSVTANAITSPNSSAITVTASTTLAGGTTGTSLGPNLSNSATNQAVLGFSLQTTGSLLNLNGITVTATSDPDIVFNNIRLISSTDNDFATAVDNVNHSAVVTTPGNSITLGTFGTAASLSGVIRYFFVVADVNTSFSVSNPTIQLSLTTANTTVSTGSVVGSTQTGVLYTFVDSTPPTIVSITNNVNPIFEGALTQTVVVLFSESMNATGAFNPAITLTGANWGAQAAGGWSTNAFSNDTYTTTFIHNGTQQTIPAAVATISVNTPRDLGGNATTNAPISSASFVVDTQKPTATVTTSPAVITTNNLSALQVTVQYSESMNTNTGSVPPRPVINLSGGSFNPLPIGVWSSSVFTNDTYTVSGITHNGTAQEIASVTASVTGARDANGNVQVASPASNAFKIDTQRPTVLSLNRQTPSTALPINNTSVVFRVTFSESVTGVDPTDFTKVQPGLTSGAITINPISGTIYDVTVPSISGDGTLTLHVLNTATILDAESNAYNVNFTSGQIFTIDNTPPLLSVLLPDDNKLSVPIPSTAGSVWTISLNEPVQAGVGNITIRRSSDDVAIATIPIVGAAIGISGNDVNITPFNNVPSVALVAGVDYYVQVPSGVIRDLAGNAYAGFVDNASWNFQTYATPSVTLITKSPSATALAGCVGEIITLTGQYFSGYNVANGIQSVTFYDNVGGNATTTSTGITVLGPTSLTVVVPATASITTQTQLKVTSKTEVIPSLGTNVGALSVSFSPLINLGPTSATMALFTPGQFEVCNTGTITTRDIKVTTAGGNSGPSSYNVIYSITGTIPTPNGSVGSYTSASAISANPPGVGNYNYQIVSVTDQFGCPSPSNTGTATVREYTANTIALNSTNQPVPVCLANSPNTTIAINTTINGSSVAGAIFSRGNGQGGWPASPTATLGGAAPTNPPTNQTFTTTTTYTFNIQDYALPAGTPLTLTLTTTGSNAVCQEATLPVVVTFATSASGSINTNNPSPLCQAVTPTNTTVTLNGTVTGGASGGVWQAFSDAGGSSNITSPTNFTGGTYFADISGIAPGFSGPGYQTAASSGAVSISYTYSNFNGGVAHFKLIPSGGTCGSSSASGIYTVTANPVPAPTPGANPLNVCVGDQEFYNVTNTPNSTYTWTVAPSPFFGSILGGQNTNAILVKWLGGIWNSSTNYSLDDVVSENGILYKSLAGGNAGNQPSTSPAQWSSVTWSSTTTYNNGDFVNHNNTWWQSNTNGNVNNTPVAGPNWTQVSPGLSVVEVTQASCSSLPVAIPVNIRVLPQLAFVSPPGRLFGSNDGAKSLTGTAVIPGFATSGTTTFSGNGVFQNAGSQWFFSPINVASGSPPPPLPITFDIVYAYQENATSSQCQSSISDSFTVFQAGSGLALTPTLPNNEYCQDFPMIRMELSNAFKNQLSNNIQRDLEDFVLVDAGGGVITTNQDFSVAGIITSTSPTGLRIVTHLGTPGAPTYRTDSYAEFFPPEGPTLAAPNEFTIAARYRDAFATLNTLTTQIITLNDVPVLDPVTQGIAAGAFCTDAVPQDLRSNNSSDITNFIFALAEPDLSTSNPNDAVIAPDPNQIIRVKGGFTDRYELVPSNGLPLFTGTDYETKDLLFLYGFQNAKGCNDTTTVNLLNVKINRRPPAPTIEAINPDLSTVLGADICVVNSENPRPARIVDNITSSDDVARYNWFDASSLTGVSQTTKTLNPNLDPNKVDPNGPLGPRPYYAVQSLHGCQSPLTQVRYLIFRAPAFTWNRFYLEGSNPIEFTEVLPGAVQPLIDNLTWNISDSGGNTLASIAQPSPATTQKLDYLFSSPDVYNVELVVTSKPSEGSCPATISQSVVIVASATANTTSAYDEKFDNTSGGWLPLGKNVSWEYGQPGPSKSKLGTSKLWATKLDGIYNDEEFSYLYSPYIDMTGLTRPMISFDSWIDMDVKDASGNSTNSGDGIVLQYSVDNKVIGNPTKVWKNLGSINFGIKWYNKAFITANPASINGTNGNNNPNIGWGGSDQSQDKFDNAKYVLDDPRSEGTHVVFRFAFASTKVSGGAIKGSGFAFDNIRIGNRTRTVLLENFRNAGNTNAIEKTVNNKITEFVSRNIGTQLLLVNYHVGFPNLDPFNQDNGADPSSRALYYGITNTPRSRLDGDDGGQPDQPFTAWGANQYDVRTLQLGLASIVFDPETAIDQNRLKVKVNITPSINLDDKTTLHIAVVEDTVMMSKLPQAKKDLIKSTEEGFNYLLKKMLPTAVGQKTGPLTGGETYTFEALWEPNAATLYPPDDVNPNISVIVFLQNEATKEVYQAEISQRLNYPKFDVVTGLDQILDSEKIGIFPNPADNEVTVELPAAAPGPIAIQMVDQVGRPVYAGVFEQGTKSKTISTKEMAGGIYLLQLGSGKVSTRTKVMVVHR